MPICDQLLKGKVICCFMPTYLYLRARLNANRVRQLRSNFLAYYTSLGLCGGCQHRQKKVTKYHLIYSTKS